MATQTYLGRFVIDADSKDLTVDDGVTGAIAVSLDIGKYFMAGATGETQLVEHMQAQIRLANAAFDPEVSVTFDYTTGKVSFTFSGAQALNFTVVFTDTNLRTLLGYTADFSSGGGATQTAGNEAKYVWRPNRSFSTHPVERGRLLESESTTTINVAKDGTTTSAVGSLLKRADPLSYMMLAEARIIVPSTGTVNRELETFFDDVVHKGEHVRIFPDDTATATANFTPVVIVDDSGEVGSFSDFSRRHIRNYNGLWDVDIPCRKVV